MSDLIDIREKIEDTHAVIAKVRVDLANEPRDDRSAMLLRSLEKRLESLESTFRKIANAGQIEVCSYRLIRDSDDSSFPIAAVGDTLKNFQTWLTVVFDAIETGPKKRSRPSIDVVKETTLDFAYTYPGSLGVVFTVPNQRDLFDKSNIDQAIDAMFKMLQVNRPAELADFAKAYGISAIHRMYDWASNHANYSVSADIKWRRGETIRNEILIQSREAANLCGLIDAASDIESHPLSVTGELVGLDVVTRSFHMRFPDADDIKGQLADSFVYRGERLNLHYRVQLTRDTVTHYATEEEKKLDYLVSLELT
jgi:hypothetical protein